MSIVSKSELSRNNELNKISLFFGLDLDSFINYYMLVPREGFTPREQEVHDLVIRGFSNRDIAESLIITEGTARNFVERITKKIGVHGRRQLPGLVLDGHEMPTSALAMIASLSPRERQVAICVGQGYSNREIAQELVISVAVVQNYVFNIREKIGAKSRTYLMAMLAGRS